MGFRYVQKPMTLNNLVSPFAETDLAAAKSDVQSTTERQLSYGELFQRKIFLLTRKLTQAKDELT